MYGIEAYLRWCFSSPLRYTSIRIQRLKAITAAVPVSLSIWSPACLHAKCIGHIPVKMNIYRRVFNEMKPPLKLNKPIKDQCDKCLTYKYKTKAGALDEASRKAMREHIERKNEARQQKAKDKINKDITVCTFDLQQVMTVPKLQVGQAYFLRKLNNMNLTIFDMSSDQGYCYLWDEDNGQKGTNEVFTSLHKWLGDIEDNQATKDTAVLWSDSTGAQNRNKFMSAGLINFLASATKIHTI